ncbi:hypothetical protein A3A14_00675 [Candidatus Daviesbacteria bacterium RIFCSPLOWO2_01_FULL_43_38]|uniref:LytR/CpsA/Psr regulator C-terminal domain-containing protein n=2 Tax=Candidatus Daviesiibacteriota TaxID=1752718 RepID=A0A1F5K2U0_9BACT|nr:MAG: hypothetical protein UV41_C0067G0008 [Candidatus Daviesbacteria bacterium GW2011_GWA2_42_7]OGE20510.1 MAG: hypothetical protein A2874_01465 [Candidatus Daviesbacteria bacterium RIFCSPHIGHO2_01_FULL_43_17]OGE35115.1 MAG: hypothetical protein A3E45_03230 [Candidatus Daviesbacteria bacterium RIFCSPHIGHO2_12_FULL_43_11]OGE63253.1 MAG: hypothetical protein A3A14_00675 [Candidatus Daviesbacteria bacterium RIFCSPLOWO2_01_FULL_43_38]
MPRSALKKVTHSKRKLSRPRRPSRTKLGVAVLAFLLGLILFSKIGGLFGSGEDISFKNYIWNGNSTLNLVVKSDNIYVASYNPQDSSFTILKVPDETYASVPLGFGRWPMRSVYDLGQAEKPLIGARLLKDTTGMLFGVPVDGYILTSGNFGTMAENARKNPFSIIGAIRESKTDLNIVESIRFWWGVKGVRFDRFKSADLENSDLTSWALLPDGSRGLELDGLRLDQFIQSRFEDSKLKDEGLGIGILNATDHPGLAEKAARVVTNIGGRVILTGNLEERQHNSFVLGKDGYTQTRLSQVFAPACIQTSWPLGLFRSGGCFLQSDSFNFSRAEVTIVLGEDYFLRYNSTKGN